MTMHDYFYQIFLDAHDVYPGAYAMAPLKNVEIYLDTNIWTIFAKWYSYLD